MLAMSTFVSPPIFLVSLLAGWLNQEQQKFLEYLQEENRVLKAQLGQRLRLSDEQRRRLAAKGEELGRKLLVEVATLVTPVWALNDCHDGAPAGTPSGAAA